jgi:hypothetical protein
MDSHGVSGHLMEVNAIVIGVGVGLGLGCFTYAAICWWKRVKARYDPIFIERISMVEENGHAFEVDEKALRRMMKETSKEMDWTKVRWQ